MKEKIAMRKEIIARLTALSPESKVQKSKLIADMLMNSVWWKESALVCVYYSMKSEVATPIIFEQARASGKIVAAPRIQGDALIFHDCTAPETRLSTHPMGMQEPVSSIPVIDFVQFKGQALVLVPGLAFDNQLNRLGRGKGYYDKFISTLQNINKSSTITKITYIGIGFTEQLVNQVPVTELDKPLDAIIMDSGIKG